MQKYLLSVLLLLLLLVPGFLLAQACSPDPNVTKPGLSPDSATNFVKGQVGVPYLQLVTIVVPKDTQVIPKPAPPIKFDSIVMTGLTGLPASLSYACHPKRCVWPGDSKGCIIITGTPQSADAGTHNLTFTGNAYLGGGSINSPISIKYYRIIIEKANGISYSVHDPGFSLEQNTPNPARDNTQFSYTLSHSGQVLFCIYNMLGKPVHMAELRSMQGKNSYVFDTSTLPPGVYTYSVSNGKNHLSRRMIMR